MKTIEELKVEKTFYRREYDSSGKLVRAPYQKMGRREPVLVTPGVRFGYFLLDLVFYYILTFIIITLAVVISLSANPEDYTVVAFITEYERLINMTLFFLFYFSTEYFFGGTFGKLICGYTVIDQHAEKMNMGTSLLRTICRYVPFEAFSSFGERSWHDKWSKTYVVKRKERDELKKLLNTLHDDKDLLD
ncbi:RDD family protein [Crocinitomicaceae bacterium CZZ-1]|uniref:RDD family protein n=1 Tax=Taishania pollutisoli TaxID=2766479 RepID=A0A8J6P7A2_9FLAO|nr:RDD family protein [Taishania pollutisoli]MBC9811206.1 RDD family protein [Taishania pollutisoli]